MGGGQTKKEKEEGIPAKEKRGELIAPKDQEKVSTPARGEWKKRKEIFGGGGRNLFSQWRRKRRVSLFY